MLMLGPTSCGRHRHGHLPRHLRPLSSDAHPVFPSTECCMPIPSCRGFVSTLLTHSHTHPRQRVDLVRQHHRRSAPLLLATHRHTCVLLELVASYLLPIAIRLRSQDVVEEFPWVLCCVAREIAVPA